MDYGKIRKLNDKIQLREWENIINSHQSLTQASERKTVNPFTKKSITVSNIGVAYYIENKNQAGNIALEEGELLTTGVPISICKDIAAILGAKVFEDDRS